MIYLPIFYLLVVLFCYIHVYHCYVRKLLPPSVELPFFAQRQLGHQPFKLYFCIINFLHLLFFARVVSSLLELFKRNGAIGYFLLDKAWADVDEIRFLYVLEDCSFLFYSLVRNFKMRKWHDFCLSYLFEVLQRHLLLVRTQHRNHFLHFLHPILLLDVVKHKNQVFPCDQFILVYIQYFERLDDLLFIQGISINIIAGYLFLVLYLLLLGEFVSGRGLGEVEALKFFELLVHLFSMIRGIDFDEVIIIPLSLVDMVFVLGKVVGCGRL